jgi:hypothetical protein
MFGAFITYVGNHAKCGCDPEGERLKQGTAAEYCIVHLSEATSMISSVMKIPSPFSMMKSSGIS